MTTQGLARPPRQPPAGPDRTPRPSVRNRSLEPHHRRRRAAVLIGIGVVLLLVAISALSGGGGTTARVAHAHTGYLGRLAALAGTGPGSLVSDEQAAENTAVDRTLAYTPFVQVAGAQHREMALTFDDGPGPFTPQVLSVLEREAVPATFFTVGSQTRYFHASTSQEVADGFPVGDHTEAHAPMSKLPIADQRSQLLKEISATGEYGAPFPRLFRPPYGLWNNDTLSVLRGFKMLMILWTIDTEDYRLPGVDAIVSRVLTNARPGAIVLMHDAGGQRQETIAALPQIIAGLRARGYKLVTVPRLLLDNPPPGNQAANSVLGAGG